jgi:serpin B
LHPSLTFWSLIMASCTPNKAIRTFALFVATTGLLQNGVVPANGGEVEQSPLIRGNNAFALELYHHISRESRGNVICSPFSITEALAMTYAGARGATREQMAAVLHFPPGDGGPNQELAELRGALGRDPGPGVSLQIANRLWLQHGLDIVPSFIEILRASHVAQPGHVDFVHRPEQARQVMNGWIAEKTGGQIKELLTSDDVVPQTRIVLTNAISFVGKWEKPFNPNWTRPAPFHLPGEKSVEVPLMNQEGRFRYASLNSTEVGELLEKTYADQRLAMLILLPPKKPGGLERLERALDAKALGQWIAQLRPRDVLLSLPKFHGSSRQELSSVLAGMGMELAFDDKADFSGITQSEHLCLARVVHEAVVEVDEQGTKAYASSAASQEARSLPTMFRVDHPFVFLITDRMTGAILFFGRVTDPVAQSR